MKLPAAAPRLRLDPTPPHAPYPPLGFVPFAEHAFGNGDGFGLYWPIGREQHEPIVAEMVHDEGRIVPSFGGVDAFLTATRDLADDDMVEAPSIEQDPTSPLACLEAARAMVSDDARVAEAIALLERAVAVLPEYGQAQAALCMQYLRARRTRAAVAAGLMALIAPPCWGGGSQQVLHRLRSLGPLAEAQDGAASDAALDADPIWIARHELSMAFGGAKHNPDYAILARAIDHYAERGDNVRAFMLAQGFAEAMSSETLSFRERHGYDERAFVARLVQMSAALPGGPRTSFA